MSQPLSGSVAPNPLDPHGASIYPCAESVRRSQHLSVRRIRAPYPWAFVAPTKKFTEKKPVHPSYPCAVSVRRIRGLSYPCAVSVRRSQHLSVRRIRAPYPWAFVAPTKKFTEKKPVHPSYPCAVSVRRIRGLSYPCAVSVRRSSVRLWLPKSHR